VCFETHEHKAISKKGDSEKNRAVTQKPVIAPSVAKPSAFRPVFESDLGLSLDMIRF
jgi:hypothetical protein